jgi:hypothetical protein
MAYAAARTWVTGEVVTGAVMNQGRDNLAFLKGEDWSTPSLLNGWAIYTGGGSYGGPQYRKVGNVVKLRGLCAGGTTSGTQPAYPTLSTGTIFQLPVGYRPIERMTFLCLSNANAFARVDVTDNLGEVISFAITTNTWLSLANVQFLVA